jgi:hypothetical protein
MDVHHAEHEYVAPYQILIHVSLTGITANDGHDTSVTTAGSFVRRFLEPLLSDERFMKNTLILLSNCTLSPDSKYQTRKVLMKTETAFDETERYYIPNIVFSVLLGDAVPKSKWGTKDDRRYDHYSMAATVENNWDLGDLGLNDVRARRFY